MDDETDTQLPSSKSASNTRSLPEQITKIAQTIRDLILFAPIIHISLCFIYIFFYCMVFGQGVENFFGYTDVFRVSLRNISWIYLILVLEVTLVFEFNARFRPGNRNGKKNNQRQTNLLGCHKSPSPPDGKCAKSNCRDETILALSRCQYIFCSGVFIIPVHLVNNEAAALESSKLCATLYKKLFNRSFHCRILRCRRGIF